MAFITTVWKFFQKRSFHASIQGEGKRERPEKTEK
jgi:hypothetical protein